MPRIYTSDSDPLDFCKKCFPSEKDAIRVYGSLGDGSDGRGNCFSYNEDHPDYSDDFILCTKCGKELNKKDN